MDYSALWYDAVSRYNESIRELVCEYFNELGDRLKPVEGKTHDNKFYIKLKNGDEYGFVLTDEGLKYYYNTMGPSSIYSKGHLPTVDEIVEELELEE